MTRKSHARPDFTFVTYEWMPKLDPDDRLALEALRRRGFDVAIAVWSDPEVDWARAGTCVVRSTWDYHRHYTDFLAWADRVAAATRLVNSAAHIRWNINKSYMLDLDRRGTPIVSTVYRTGGSRIDLERDIPPWKRIVIKPAVGLSTFGVKRFDKPAQLRDAQAHADALLSRGDVLVQPYVESVETYGERALIFIDGHFSHAVRKTAFQPLLPAGEAGESPASAQATEIDAGRAALAAIGSPPPTYARVDLVQDDRGNPLVIELELIEPSLFLSMHPPAAEAFARALVLVRRQDSRAG